MQVPDWVAVLPAVNAGLNSLATLLLIAGYVLIRQSRRQAHKRAMLAAFAVSIAFLACYVVYHAALQHYTGEGSKKFLGTGIIRPVYFAILISHVVLAALVPVLAIMTIRRGLIAERPAEPETSSARWAAHRRIARWTFPIWVYVSVTGVIIYVMLYHF